MTVSRCLKVGGNTEISEERGRKPEEGGRGGEGARKAFHSGCSATTTTKLQSETIEGAHSSFKTSSQVTSSRRKQEKTETATTEQRASGQHFSPAVAGATAVGAAHDPKARKEALGNNRKSCKKDPITCSSSCRSRISGGSVPQTSPFPPCPLLSSSSSLPSSPSSSSSSSPSNGLHVTTCPNLKTRVDQAKEDKVADWPQRVAAAFALLFVTGLTMPKTRAEPSGKSSSSFLNIVDLFLVPNVVLAVITSSSLLWKASPPSALLEDISGNFVARLQQHVNTIEHANVMQDFSSPLASAFSPVFSSEKFQPRRTADPTGVYGPEESVMGWETDSAVEGKKSNLPLKKCPEDSQIVHNVRPKSRIEGLIHSILAEKTSKLILGGMEE